MSTQTNGLIADLPSLGSMQYHTIQNTPNEMSNNIADIAVALSKAQSELEAVGKTEQGYGYNYASLTDTIRVAKPVLSSHGLSVTQLVGNDNQGNPAVTTILVHSSGQYFKSFASMPSVEMKGCNTAQQMGATISYLRRYALQAILNMSSEDNDASSNGFSKPTTTSSFKKATPKVEAKKETKSSGQKFRRKKKVTEVEDDL